MNGTADVTGVLVLGACAAWALITAAGRDARPEGLLLAVLAVGAGYATGRIAGSLAPVGAAAGAGAASVFLAFFGPSSRVLPGTFDFAGPAGRSGVTAALLTLAVGALCCAAWAAQAGALRTVLRLLAAGTVVCALLVGTPVGFAAALAVLVCSLAVGGVRRRPVCLAAAALAVAAVSGVTFAVAQDVLPRAASTALNDQLTGHRVQLWQDAAAVTRQHPLLGTGPDTFRELSPTARGAHTDATRAAVSGQEADTAAGAGPATAPVRPDGKPHSAPLQMAAEQGLPGLALLAAAFGWLLLALWASPRPTPVVLTAGAALSALAALASIGNALSFTQVTAGAGLLAGIACARRLG